MAQVTMERTSVDDDLAANEAWIQSIQDSPEWNRLSAEHHDDDGGATKTARPQQSSHGNDSHPPRKKLFQPQPQPHPQPMIVKSEGNDNADDARTRQLERDAIQAKSSVKLTEEQLDILQSCPPPLTPLAVSESSSTAAAAAAAAAQKGQLFRVTAAAGAGKTTTLLQLAVQAHHQGHCHITYLTFGKDAAEEGKSRIRKRLAEHNVLENVIVDARTLHSSAYQQIVSDHRRQGNSKSFSSDDSLTSWDEKRFKLWISETCASEIDAFMNLGCNAMILVHVKALQQKEVYKQVRQLVENFIFKSFSQFCHSAWTLEEYMAAAVALSPKADNASCRKYLYYPALLFHQTGGSSSNSRKHADKFEPTIYMNHVGFYAQQAHRLFRLSMEQNLFTFDLCVKRAQLSNLAIPGTILLIDEAQDLDDCQIDWAVRTQVQHGKHVYVVGDAAQTIYGFRGANSQALIDLEADRNLYLLGSFRFGARIADMAQCLLFVKEQSNQTGQLYQYHEDLKRRFRPLNWMPYQIYSAVGGECDVIDQPLLSRWRTCKLALIARYNATLFAAILGAFTIQNAISDDENGAVQFHFDADNFPKVHVAGAGSSSGAKRFGTVFTRLESLLELYLGHVSSLPGKDFPEFEGQKKLSWGDLKAQVTELDLGSYVFSVGLVETYEENTIAAVEFFKAQVLDKRFTADEADIVLTTCHAAKGLEWDNVQVCDDFLRLGEIKRDDRILRVWTGNRWDNKPFIDDKWIFQLVQRSDELNLLYVACTRAKRLLSIPSSLAEFLDALDNIFCQHQQGVPDTAGPCTSLVLPLRKQLELLNNNGTLLRGHLISDNYFEDADEHGDALPIVTQSMGNESESRTP